MATSIERDPIGFTVNAASDSVRILSEGFYVVFESYCQLGSAAIEAWLKSMSTLSVLPQAAEAPTAEIVRIRPRRA